MTGWIVLGVLVAWILLGLKTSRPDGTPVRVQPYRRTLFYLLRSRAESIVFFDTYVDAEALVPFMDQARAKFGADYTHVALAAASIGLAATPAMNAFVAGRRLYARKGRFLTFTMKRKALDRKAKLATVKIESPDGETFPELCARVNAVIGVERSDATTYTDKELAFFGLFPRLLFRAAIAAFHWADYHNLVPGAFIRTDPLYTSMFIANLGSLDMAPAFHHLFEYGTCPLFLTVGSVEDVPAVEDGRLVVKKRLHLRWSYDERIADGLNARYGIDAVKRVLEDPYRWLGGVADDGSDVRPLWPRADWT